MNICTSKFSVIIDVRAIIEPWNPNKTKKDWIIILADFSLIIILSIILYVLFIVTTNPQL